MGGRYSNKLEAALDVGERLFAGQGFYTVTLREIAREANLSVADINSCFESKEKLFYAIVERRATQINLMRVERLVKVDINDASEKALRPLIKAFFDPLYIKSCESEGWKNYLRLVPQIMRQRSPILIIVTEFYTPISDLFMNRLYRIFIGVDKEVIRKYWHFALLTYFSVFLDDFHVGDFQMGIPGAPPITGSRQENFQRAEAFVLAGFESLLKK